jgi:tetratricopeptide (TPR) repeat protein
MRRRAILACFAAALLAAGISGMAAAQSGRLLSAGAVTARDDHLDLAIEFTCSLPYGSHTPAAEGDSIRVTLAVGADCGLGGSAQFPIERIAPADARDLVRDIELQPGLAGGAELIVRWNRREQFLLVPTSGMRGLRIRVQRRAVARVDAGELEEPTADYAVNLASQQQPFDAPALAAAEALLRTRIYVSQIEVEGSGWYRLRAGPFATREEAGEILRLALARYPAAWLGIADEPTATPEDSAASIEGTPGTRRPEVRSDAALDRQLDAARAALNARQFAEAVRSLTQILAAEDYERRREGAELLGLARERQGQLAQAKAVYEDYLRRYPDSPAAGRVRERLQALRLAGIPGRQGTRGGEDHEGWSAAGNASQVYRRDDAHLATQGLVRDVVTQNAVLTDLDGLLRRRGSRFDFTARTSLGQVQDLQPSGEATRLRVSSAYAELALRSRSLLARVGRQSRGMAGVNGLFDGALGSWQARPRLGASLAAGAPVESSRLAPDFDRVFVGGAIELASRSRRWEASAFALAQQFEGNTDRRSIGMEARYLAPGRTLVAMSDYDVFFDELNGAMLLGTLVTDSRWTFSIDAGVQRSPQLALRNALIGQPTVVFADLADTFPDSQIEQLALDRTARATQLSATASRPLGERGQWTLNMASFGLEAMPASGGVAEVPAPGREDSLSGELLLNGLLRAGDTHAFALRAQRGGSASLLSAGVASRLPLGTGWRLTSRLRVERREAGDDGRTWVWAPSLRLEYQRGGSTFELEAGADLSRRHAAGGADRSTRRYLSAGYRIFLDRRR